MLVPEQAPERTSLGSFTHGVTLEHAQPCNAPMNGSNKEVGMSEHVYKVIELVGSSKVGIEDAAQNAIAKAAATVRNMRWFEVMETRGYIEEGQVAYWQVTVKIGFTIED
jgi:flavin-binding protein dodecin